MNQCKRCGDWFECVTWGLCLACIGIIVAEWEASLDQPLDIETVHEEAHTDATP